MNDWPADPRLDAELRMLVHGELAAARTDGVGFSRRHVSHRGWERAAAVGLAAVAVIAIVATLALRGVGHGGIAGASGAAGSPGASGQASPTAAGASPTASATSSGSPASSSLPGATPTPAIHGAGSFTPTGPMTTSDSGEAVLLLDGRVLIVGNSATSPELYDPKTGKFTSTGPAPRDGNFGTATRLADGRVLFAGGYDGTSTIATALIYDPDTGKFTDTGPMTISRLGQTATLLNDGRVLIAGGETYTSAAVTTPIAVAMDYRPAAGPGNHPPAMTGPDMLKTAEIYDPTTSKFTRTGSMTTGRDAAGAAILPDGRVLIAGGGNEGSAAVRTAEIYNPKTGKFSATGSMAGVRYAFNTTVLRDGRVLISAGNDGNGPVFRLEIYNPKTARFTAAGSTGNQGFFLSALLANGRVLLVGGFDQTAGKISGYMVACQIFDPTTGKLSPAASMSSSHLAGSATTLGDGTVLVAGGVGGGDPGPVGTAELYRP